jgi:hypothetical protein
MTTIAPSAPPPLLPLGLWREILAHADGETVRTMRGLCAEFRAYADDDRFWRQLWFARGYHDDFYGAAPAVDRLPAPGRPTAEHDGMADMCALLARVCVSDGPALAPHLLEWEALVAADDCGDGEVTRVARWSTWQEKVHWREQLQQCGFGIRRRTRARAASGTGAGCGRLFHTEIGRQVAAGCGDGREEMAYAAYTLCPKCIRSSLDRQSEAIDGRIGAH